MPGWACVGRCLVPAPREDDCEPGNRPGASPPSRPAADLDLGSLVPALASRGSCNPGLAAAGPASEEWRGETAQGLGVHGGGLEKLSLGDSRSSSTVSWTKTFMVGVEGAGGTCGPAGALPPGPLAITPAGALGHLGLRLWALAVPPCPWLHCPISASPGSQAREARKKWAQSVAPAWQRPCRAGPLDT